jgi:hypothetical protein
MDGQMDGWLDEWMDGKMRGRMIYVVSSEFHGSGDCPRTFNGARLDSDSGVLIRAKKKADVQDGVSRWSER